VLAVPYNATALRACRLEQGADCSLQDDDGETALHKAAAADHTAVALLLAKRNPAVLCLRNRHGKTPADLPCAGAKCLMHMSPAELSGS
jgi:ankyrin repeat protein